ncbi:hypothetical protein GCM10009682_39450 [Luedemannella flava]|uniref:Uncharacterized protein n=1 Tax=Luedemannella flava TaxID=349316 RepID=A0ABN2M8D3_9ACTN
MRGGRSGAGLAAVAGLVLAAAAGCGSGGSPTEAITSAAAWAPPPRYAFTLYSSCGERWLIGRFGVTVVNGEVSAVEGLDEPARLAVKDRDLKFLREVVPTLSGMAAEAANARANGADVVEVTVDKTDGHLTRVDIDPAKNAIDDESCYTITDYRVLTGTPT